MAMKGMDIDMVAEFGTKVRTEFVDALAAVRTSVLTTGKSLDWEGPDAAEFKNDLLQQFVSLTERASDALNRLGQTAIANAEAQREVSASL